MRSKGIKTPALVVALGTTASKAALELCEQLLSMDQDDRDAVAVVTIDTDTARPDFAGLLENNPGKFHAFHAAIRVPANVDQADELPHRDRRQIFLPRYIPRYYDYGAGGIRNHGHVALAYRLDEVYSALQDALASIKLLPPGHGHTVTDSVQVYVVAFLGGGTGSGIVADIGVILRDLLTTEMEGQRLLLFGILPLDRIPGAGSNEESWRKSNAAAAVMEIMATGMAARGAKSGFYRKRLLSRVFSIPDAPIFNEMYLVGRTNLNDVDNVAYMVGLDLFQRIVDASGIGDRERSQSPDFKDLKRPDDRELITNFSTSCPVEIRFPALDVCDTFAMLAAGRLLQLPDFVGEVPPEPAPSLDEQRAWEDKWGKYAIPSPGASDTGEGATLAPLLLAFDASDFVGMGPTRRRILWGQALDAMDRFPSLAERLGKVIERLENERMSEVPRAKEGDGRVSYSARRLTHLSLLRQEYAHVLDLLGQNPQDPPEAMRNEKLERGLDGILPGGLDRLLPLGPIRDNIERGRAQDVAAWYNRAIEDAWYYQRYIMMTELLKRLQKRVSELYESGKRDVAEASSGEKGREFVDRALASQVWQGKLSKAHPHQMGLFDLERFRETQTKNKLAMQPAMVGLFRWATITPKEGENVLTGCDKPLDITDFDAELRANWLEDCIAYLNEARRQDIAEMSSANLSESERRDALAVDATRMPDRVLEYFRQQYRAFFKEQNLFDLLRVGYAAETGRSMGQAWREVPSLLRVHLEQASRVLRQMIKADPGLWRQGAQTVRPTLYLGVNWRKGTPEQEWIQDLARTVRFRGPLESPKVDRDEDPHRLQLNLALHAISIRTIPMFFMRYNSLTSEYIRYQSAWQGQWRAHGNGNGRSATIGAAQPGEYSGYAGYGTEQPGANGGDEGDGGDGGSGGNGATPYTPYGVGGVPVHSSEETERLTLDPRALPNPWKLNLVERILRDTPLPPQAPNWNVDDEDEDDEDEGGIVRARVGGYYRASGDSQRRGMDANYGEQPGGRGGPDDPRRYQGRNL